MKYHILTYGCQMNFADSKVLAGRLLAAGLEPTESLEQAQIVLVNTCCVRATAENRAYGRLQSLKTHKENGDLQILGVFGCLAQQDGERMLDKVPHLDLVVGTRALDRLPEHIDALIDGCEPVIDVAEGPPLQPADTGIETCLSNERGFSEPGSYPVFVSITRGCSNRCAYCVVPRVRGPVESLPSKRIIDQIRRLADNGVKEVTLIGQNVNVYREGDKSFAGLLREVHEVPGISRIRFVTSHPRDLTDETIDAVAELPKACEYFHIPMQAGSDRILKMMHRGYTSGQYRDLTERIREKVKTGPDRGPVALSTDLLVGFPGETEEDFQETLRFVQEIQWDGAYTFIYSKRAETEAENLPDKVPHKVKVERLKQIVELQTGISRKINDARVGFTEEVLIESKPQSNKMTGKVENISWRARNRNNKLIYIKPPLNGQQLNVGDILNVLVVEGRAHTLFGEVQEQQK